MKQDWLDTWESDDIPFHLATVNPMLERFWPQLSISPESCVFVPLCGKSLDLLWLAHQGHTVIGVELSEIACKAFFTENNLAFKTTIQDKFVCCYNDKITIFCGDFFALTPDMLPVITAVYDRAALVALPKKLRQRYADQLMKLTAPQSKMLILALDSSDEITMPPYPISFNELKNLYQKKFIIEEWLHLKVEEIPERLQEQGYSEIYQTAYGLVSFS